MATLRPFRQYHENDVINMFSFASLPTGLTAVNAGTLVKIADDAGWNAGQEFVTESINNSYPNTVSDRWHVDANIVRCNETAPAAGATGETPLGMMLYDVKEVDENGEKLIWHPRKYHEMQVALLGHAVPVLTRGIVMLNTVDNAGGGAVAHKGLWAGFDGEVTTDDGTNQSGGAATYIKVGVCLGEPENANTLVRLDVGF